MTLSTDRSYHNTRAKERRPEQSTISRSEAAFIPVEDVLEILIEAFEAF
jgi:hypothetical protein